MADETQSEETFPMPLMEFAQTYTSGMKRNAEAMGGFMHHAGQQDEATGRPWATATYAEWLARFNDFLQMPLQ